MSAQKRYWIVRLRDADYGERSGWSFFEGQDAPINDPAWEVVELVPEAEWLRLRKIIVDHQEASVREATQLATTKAALAQSIRNEQYLRGERDRFQREHKDMGDRLREIYQVAEYSDPTQGVLDQIANLAVSEADPSA